MFWHYFIKIKTHPPRRIFGVPILHPKLKTAVNDLFPKTMTRPNYLKSSKNRRRWRYLADRATWSMKYEVIRLISNGSPRRKNGVTETQRDVTSKAVVTFLLCRRKDTRVLPIYSLGKIYRMKPNIFSKLKRFTVDRRISSWVFCFGCVSEIWIRKKKLFLFFGKKRFCALNVKPIMWCYCFQWFRSLIWITIFITGFFPRFF